MASSFIFSETFGTSPGTTQDKAYINCLSTDESSGNDTTTEPNNHPITIPPSATAYSYERWVRGHWTSTFTSISNLRYWGSSASGTGWTWKAGLKGDQTYVTPVNSASSYATANIPTAQGSGLQPTYGTNFCTYIVNQLHVTNAASAGNIGSITFTMGWDEV